METHRGINKSINKIKYKNILFWKIALKSMGINSLGEFENEANILR